MLEKLGKDHNSFFADVKPGFQPTKLDFTTLRSVDRMMAKKGKAVVRSL